jgi:hypothetical protein
LLLLSAAAGAPAQSPSVTTLYRDLERIAPDPGRQAGLNDILLIRGGQEILLQSGTLRLLTPVGGKVVGALFEGKGSLSFAPPTAIERGEFERQTSLRLVEGKHVYEFAKAVLWFQESLLSDLGTLTWNAGPPITRSEREAVERSVKYVSDPSNENAFYRLLTEMVEPAPKPYLLAHLFLEGTKEVFFRCDPRRYEEVTLQEPPFEAITGSVFWLKTVNAFHTLEEYAGASEYALAAEEKSRMTVDTVRTDLSLASDGTMRGWAELRYRPRVPGQASEIFSLDQTLIVDSVTTGEGTPLEFHRGEKAWDLFVKFARPETAASAIRVHYDGPFLGRRLGWGFDKEFFFRPASASGWYPEPLWVRRATFDATFRLPDDLLLVPAGTTVERSVSGGTSVVRARSDGPTLNFSFTMGLLKVDSMRAGADQPLVRMYYAKEEGREFELKNLANTYQLYHSLFGSPGLAELRTTPGPRIHGEAFQGFLHLPVVEEYIGERTNAVAIGRAHEIAHIWWGLGVGAASYHDWWIGEAFSQYSALLYAPFVLNEHEQFFKKLEDWRIEILGNRKFALGSGPVLGPIWLGYRASSEKTQGDYALSTYKKGAWVLHMLRMMMIDLRTQNEDAFKAMMQEFYARFKGTDASTEDFRLVVEKYFRADMRWFFEQWVYGTQVPTLKCSHSVTKTPAGKYQLKITVEEKQVSGPFIVSLPFEIRMGDQDVRRARLFIDKPTKEFTYELDAEPKKVSFNILSSVLCEIEE